MWRWAFLFGLLSCTDRSHIALLEPATTSEATGGTAGESSIVTEGGGGGGGTVGLSRGGATSTAARSVWRNLMLVKQTATIDGVTYTFNDAQLADIETNFKVAFPALIADLTAGVLAFENEVAVSDLAVTSLGYADNMVEPENAPDWTDFAGATGTWDTVFLMSPRPQGTTYARGTLAVAPIVGWCSVSARTDGGAFSEELPGWLFAWLAEVGNMFYEQRLLLENVPKVDDAGRYGYSYQQGGYMNYIAYYKDVLNRSVSYNGALLGLGEPAWSLGTLREWAVKQ